MLPDEQIARLTSAEQQGPRFFEISLDERPRYARDFYVVGLARRGPAIFERNRLLANAPFSTLRAIQMFTGIR